MDPSVIAVDLGGTNLRAAIVSGRGAIDHRLQVPTPADEGPGAVVAAIVAAVRTVAAEAEGPVAAVSIGAAGLINAETGMVILSPNMAGFRNVEVTPVIREALELPAFIENDATAAALGEFRYGAGQGTRHLLHVTLGTGVGGGIVINRRLYRGATGLAGEIGHMVVDAAGPRCNCGSRGCLEAIVSGTAFAARARRLIATGAAPRLAAIASGREPTAADLQQAASEGETAAAAEIANGGHTLGIAFGSLVNVLNPDAITISGGLMSMGDLLFGPMLQAFRSIAYGPASGTGVRFSELGDDAGLLGAAAVGYEHLEDGG